MYIPFSMPGVPRLASIVLLALVLLVGGGTFPANSAATVPSGPGGGTAYSCPVYEGEPQGYCWCTDYFDCQKMLGDGVCEPIPDGGTEKDILSCDSNTGRCSCTCANLFCEPPKRRLFPGTILENIFSPGTVSGPNQSTQGGGSSGHWNSDPRDTAPSAPTVD